ARVGIVHPPSMAMADRCSTQVCPSEPYRFACAVSSFWTINRAAYGESADAMQALPGRRTCSGWTVQDGMPLSLGSNGQKIIQCGGKSRRTAPPSGFSSSFPSLIQSSAPSAIYAMPGTVLLGLGALFLNEVNHCAVA